MGAGRDETEGSTMKIATRIFAATGAIALAAALPVHVSANEPVRVSVKYSDLDLSTDEGRAALENRIEAAARQMCGMDGTLTTGSRMPSYSMRACYKKATSQIGESIARAIEKSESKS